MYAVVEQERLLTERALVASMTHRDCLLVVVDVGVAEVVCHDF